MFEWIEGAFDLIINYSIILLEFKLGSEVLRTVVVRSTSELLIAGAIVLLRAAMTFLIHWEIKNEKAEHQEAK